MNILQTVTKLDANDSADDTIQTTRFFTLNGHKAVVVSEKSARTKEIDEVGARYYALSLRPNIFLMPLAIFKLSQIIIRENIDIVHARDASSSFAALFASRFTERPFITTVYEYHKKSLFEKSQFWAKRVICFDESDARNLVKRGFLSESKARVIPPFINSNVTNPAPLARKDGSFVIGAAVPLFSTEARQNFIRAISILSRTINKLKVFITDSSPRREKDAAQKLKLLIKRHSLINIVTHLPQGEDIMPMTGLDLFVQINADKNPSAKRLLLAQASGIPIVTTCADWISDYAEDKKTALVCQSPAAQEIASRINDLYKNKELQSQITSAAKTHLKENFKAENIMKSTLALYEDALSGVNILIIKIGALGDCILVTPSVRAVREKFPKATIRLLTGLEQREVFMNSPYIDELIVCDFKRRDKGVRGLLRVGKKLRNANFDVVVDLQNNKKSHLLSFLSYAPRRFGYDNGKLGFLLNRKIKETHVATDPIEHQSKVLGLLGIYNIGKRIELWPTKEDRAWADNFLSSHWVKGSTKLVALNIDSSPKWVTKLWPIEYFTEVFNKLAKNFGIRAVLIGREKNSPRIEGFLKHAKCKPILAMGKTNISRLASLVKKCDLLLSSDSAPIHVACAMGTPFIALFGPTDPKRHLASSKNAIVFNKNLKCSPCYSSHCNEGYACMLSIKPEEVYEATLKLLGIKRN